MVSNKTSKFIKSLQLKKHRLQEKKFVVEGTKSVNELISSDYELTHILATDKFMDQCDTSLIEKDVEFHTVTPGQLSKVSGLKNNDAVLAVANIKSVQINNDSGKLLALDDIKDPGNMGTIIRIADWYGIKTIICSPTCVDFYNPKVIQATMGSFTRVEVTTVALESYLSKISLPVMGAVMEGENIHQFKFPEKGILVIGNESNGISSEVAPSLTHKVTIPSFGGAESLNASIATAIICDRWLTS